MNVLSFISSMLTILIYSIRMLNALFYEESQILYDLKKELQPTNNKSLKHSNSIDDSVEIEV